MTYTLTGTYALGDLTGRDGEHLRFTPSTTIVGDDTIILPAPVGVTLAADGTFSVELVGTDDPAYAPSGWVWTVQELMDGGRAPWSFELTADSDLSELASTTPPGSYVTLVPTSRTLTAGAGLTGGGTLAADRTFAVGAGTGVTVAADVVSVDTSVIATVAYADAAQAAAEATAAGALASHAGDSTAVHGIADTAALVVTTDARLSDARTPTAHASTHAAAGADPVTVAESQVTGLTTALGLKAPLASPALTGTPTAPTAALTVSSTQIATTAFTAGYAAARATVGNLLTANQASGTDTLGTTVGFSAGSCTLTSTTTSPGHGTRSLRVVATGSVPSVYIGSTATPLDGNSIRVANPDAPMTFFGRARTETATVTTNLRCYWFDAAGALITSASYPTLWTLTSTWADYQSTIMPPSGSAYVVLRIYQTLATDIFELDKLGAWAGAGGEWAMPGTPIANLGTKVSHPNVDDVLVQRWDSSKATPGWQTIHYDSGWRDVGALVTTGVATAFRLRRVGNLVYLNCEWTSPASGGAILTVPTGFTNTLSRNSGLCAALTGTGASYRTAFITASSGAVQIFSPAASTAYSFSSVWACDSAIPTTLPGTLVSTAPA